MHRKGRISTREGNVRRTNWARLPLIIISIAALLIVATVVGLIVVFSNRAYTDLVANPDEIESYTVGGTRPASLLLPKQRNAETALPLIIGFHGLGGNPRDLNSYIGISPHVATLNFALLLPQGKRNVEGENYWNDHLFLNNGDRQTDDVRYLHETISEINSIQPVSRVYAVGYSNGGGFSYRLACESFPNLAAIVSLAGAPFTPAYTCENAKPISILQIHGTQDEVISYDGARQYFDDARQYPGAEQLVDRWARRAGCDTQSSEPATTADIDSTIDGNETEVIVYRKGCTDGVTIELWKINGASHGPELHETATERLLKWLLSH